MNAIAPRIIDLEEAQVAAFNNDHIEEIITFFHPEFVGFSSTKHERIAGLQALYETFEFYSNEADKLEYEIDQPTVQVAGDSAVITFYWAVTIHKNQKTQTVKGRGSHVYIQTDGDWKIIHEHFSRAHHHIDN